MIKISTYALTLALLTHGATHTNAQVNDDGICENTIASFEGDCTYQNFVDNLDNDCVLTELFPDVAEADIPAEVAAICEYDAPTQFVEIQGTYQADRRYFAGGGPLVDGENWGVDVGQIERFETNLGNSTVIAWPEYLARLDYNNNTGRGENGYPANMNLETSCQLNTAMCCFTDDSMGAGFGANGDATTDVCRHDLLDSPQSNHIKDGWSVFPGSETSTHCVGFTWEEGKETLIGNMLYDISLHNTVTKGYREGIPGAPMCGCIEHMPEVESAECRTASIENDVIRYTFSLDTATNDVSASNSAVIEYSDCGTDLASAYKANQDNAADEAKIDEYLVGDCAADLTEYLNEEQFLHEGQHATKYITPDPTKWSDIVVGEGIYFQPPIIDPVASDDAFRTLIDNACYDVVDNQQVARHCIIRRTCASCRSEAHRDIYYKRISDLPPALGEPDEIYFLDMFMNNWGEVKNEMGADFYLYSTYEDAVAGTNEWTFCDFQEPGDFDNYGFPRNCGPTGSVRDNWNSYIRGNGYANHHGFYVEKMA